jgi:hypothetical protein
MWSLLQVPEPSFFEWIAKVLLLQIQLFLLPSLACILFFFFLSLLYGFFSFVYFKQKLSEKKYKKLALVLLGILFFVVLPILEVQLSFMFAMQRNVGKLLDTYHEPLLEWSLSLGESLIRQAMGKELEQETLIELGSLREIFKTRIRRFIRSS